jgi:hypothetical protein
MLNGSSCEEYFIELKKLIEQNDSFLFKKEHFQELKYETREIFHLLTESKNSILNNDFSLASSKLNEIINQEYFHYNLEKRETNGF